MKVLILGSAGMAGHTIALYFLEKNHEVVGYARHKTNLFNEVLGDIRDTEKLYKLIQNEHFDLIINSVAILNQKTEIDKALSVYTNSYLPHELVSMTSQIETRVFQMSSESVFSGIEGNYTEKSLRDDITFYGRTKALGEIEDEKNLTFRNSVIGPDINVDGIGIFNWFMKQKECVNGYTNSMWTGLTSLEIAKVMEYSYQHNITGLVNSVNNKTISKYELLKLFNKYFRNNLIKINPYSDFICNRTLKCTRDDFKYMFPTYEEMISDMYDWVLDHKNLYQHYLDK